MRYDQLTRFQKQDAQRTLDRLRAEGVITSVSQVAAHFDDASDWAAGAITLATLLDRTRWERTAPVESVHTAELPAGILRHVRKVLAADGSPDSLEALELLPEA